MDHCVRGESKQETLLDRNVESQYFLTELRALDSEYISERTANILENIH